MEKKDYYEYDREDGKKAILSSKVLGYRKVILLVAEPGKVITDGTETWHSLYVPEGEVENYTEIDSEVKEDV